MQIEQRHLTREGVQCAYQKLLDGGRFMIQRCGGCVVSVFFPRELCPRCGGTHLEWIEPAGLGTVYSVTCVRRNAELGGDYNVSIIELDEGVRMMSRVESIPATNVKIGLRVQAHVVVNGGRGLVLFIPVPGAEDVQ